MASPCSHLMRVVCGLAVSFVAVIGAQTPPLSLVAVVQTPEHDPIVHVMVRIDSAGLGPYETTDSGRFVFPLTANLRVGHEATFRVEPSKSKKWVIVYPCDRTNGRKDSLPDVGGNPIEIIVVPWGSSQLKKSYPPVCIIEELASQFRSKTRNEGPRASSLRDKDEGPPAFAAQTDLKYLGKSEEQPKYAHDLGVVQAVYRAELSTNHPGSAARHPANAVDPQRAEFLAAKAIELGLTVEDIAAMIDGWTIAVEDPYEKGLASLYQGRYAEASRYISASIPSPPGAFLERYVPLAFAEYQQGHYSGAEGYLRKVLTVHSDDPILLGALGTVLTQKLSTMKQNRSSSALSRSTKKR